MIKASKL